jgi:diguanylate cyclase (GGDEF)-like protein/PAS domain S-box-containing protein
MPPPGGEARDRRGPAATGPGRVVKALGRPGAIRLYLVSMCLLTAFYLAVPGLRGVSWSLIGCASVIALGVGIAVRRPPHAVAWILLAAADAAFVITDAVENAQDSEALNGSSFPSVADGVALVAYPLGAAGFWLFVRHQHNTRDWAGLIDALTVTTALALLAWSFLIWPIVDSPNRTWVSRAVSICYPLGDVLLLAVLARLMAGARARTAAAWLLAAGAIGLLASDALFQLDILHTAWRPGALADLGWIVFFVTWGLAALHPSMARVGEPGPHLVAGISALGIALLAGAALIAPSVLLVASLQGNVNDPGELAGFALVSSVLVLTRLAVVIRSYRRVIARERALRIIGDALVAAVSAEEVAAAIESAGEMLLHSEVPGRIALSGGPTEPSPTILGPTTLGQAVPDAITLSADAAGGLPAQVHRLPERLPIRLPGTPRHVSAQRTLMIPLTVKQPDGWRETGGAIVAAGSEDELAGLRDSLEILAGQAALALARVLLDQEIRRRDSEAYFRTLVHNAADVIMIVDDAARIRYASPSAGRLFGGRELTGAALDDLVDLARADGARAVLSGAEPGPVDWLIETGAGAGTAVEVRSDDLRSDETVGGVVLTLRDVTEQRRLEGELRHHAYHDPLTGLANRRRVQDRIDEAIGRVRASGRVACLLLLDLDDFKDVNDTKGHGAGDELLAAVADRLRAGLRPDDVAARLGGDEFAVLLPDVARPADADRLAERLTRAFDAQFELSDGPVTTGASIGVASTAESAGAEELLRNADLALYAAKADGKRRWRHYEPALHDHAVERAALRESLARAITEEAVELRYQPVVELGDGRVSGFEALARWPHPARGIISSEVFIPLAEETGQILPLGRLLLRRAVLDASAWNSARADSTRANTAVPGTVLRVPPLSIAVNVSIQQFRDPRFADETAALLDEAGLDARLLTLELTESDLMHHHDDQARETLTVLKDSGVRIAIDDFGTGYSSLSYLRDLPIDILKIDKSFIADVAASQEQAALVEGIIRIADALGLQVVAEGVENQAQWDLLGATDCDYGQGYLFGRPMNLGEVETLLGGERDPRLPRRAGAGDAR